MSSWSQTLTLGALLSASFLAGQWLPRPTLEAQGRGPVNPPPAPTPQPQTSATAPVVISEDGGQSSAAANGFLAVTGSYGVGNTVMYLVDTVNRQLAVYEARGGGTEQRRIVFVGARRIDLDLQLEGYNDRSEYDYRRLKETFEKRGQTDLEGTMGLTPSDPGRK
ncbi:MAG: hypothetical protein IPK26_24040 [Planctomycetes bacterium]|nr:hypothetical protein [Planctomycetota bacterium]